MALKPLLAAAPLALQLAIYVARSSRSRPSSLPGSSGRSWRPGPITALRGAKPRPRPLRRNEKLAACARRFSLSRSALPRSASACSPATPSWPTSPTPSIRCSSRRRFSSLRLRRRCAHIRPARPLWRRARSFCSRSRCLASTLSTAARPDCRWSRRPLRRPIPIAPRTPIRPPSRPGGSIISTSGSARTG